VCAAEWVIEPRESIPDKAKLFRRLHGNADYQVATLLSLCPGSRFKCAERTTSIVGFTANRIDPIKKSQSAARVVEVKKKKPLPITKHTAAPKSTSVRTTW